MLKTVMRCSSKKFAKQGRINFPLAVMTYEDPANIGFEGARSPCFTAKASTLLLGQLRHQWRFL